MLSEEEIEERARYCHCVYLQLSWLHNNDFAEPTQYLEILQKSSLGLGGDQFITMTIEEAMMESRPDGGLLSLISLYEGFTHAFCEVLEMELESVTNTIPLEWLGKLAEEMGISIET